MTSNFNFDPKENGREDSVTKTQLLALVNMACILGILVSAFDVIHPHASGALRVDHIYPFLQSNSTL